MNGLNFWQNVTIKFFIFSMKRSKYHHIFTHLTEKEKTVLYMLSKRLASGTIMMEIGSYFGASSCFLAWGAKKTTSVLYCVDTWKNDAMSEGKQDTYKSFMENTQEFSTMLKPLRGISSEIARTFDKKIDLLFIDGDHSYQGCYTDWVSWSPLLNPKAIVIFHDIGWAKGVQQVVHEEVSPYASKEYCLSNLYWAHL